MLRKVAWQKVTLLKTLATIKTSLMLFKTGGQLIEFHLTESVDRIFRSNA
jgi:hypothetical protein